MQVELKVRIHESGRHTLMEKNENENTPRDSAGPLFGNLDKGEFYKAVASRLAELHSEGHDIIYTDVIE